MAYKNRLIFFVCLAFFLNTLSLADEKKIGLGANSGCLYDFGARFYPYIGMNFQFNLSPKFLLLIELDYYPKLMKFRDLTPERQNHVVPSINGIFLLKPKGSNPENIIPYLSFGFGIIGITPGYFDIGIPAVYGMFKIGGGLRYHLFKEGLISTEISLHNPTLYLFPSTKDAFISINIGYSLRL